jgi:hypothetical protein
MRVHVQELHGRGGGQQHFSVSKEEGAIEEDDAEEHNEEVEEDEQGGQQHEQHDADAEERQRSSHDVQALQEQQRVSGGSATRCAIRGKTVRTLASDRLSARPERRLAPAHLSRERTRCCKEGEDEGEEEAGERDVPVTGSKQEAMLGMLMISDENGQKKNSKELGKPKARAEK